MAQQRKYANPKDPRQRYPKLRRELRAKVFAMQDTCALCGHEVDKTLPPNTPLSPELDEIIPVARGGSPYNIDNLQLTHSRCNRQKGAKLEGEMKADTVGDVPVNPIPISRAW